MKSFRHASSRLSVLAGVVSALIGVSTLAAPQPLPERIQVSWSNPADFADTQENYGVDRERPEEWLSQLARHLRYRADRALPSGQQLDVIFTDVKRAGAFEPWRGPRWDEIRIIKDIYPPRIDLRYTLTGADGTVLGEGERKLRDPAFLSGATPNAQDPLRYEKRLLDDWLRREFAPARARSG
jgi:hypothetical protein